MSNLKKVSSRQSKPGNTKYSDNQLEIIRSALSSLRCDAFSGERLSWNAITESINEAVGCQLNYKYVQKFVEGIPDKDPVKKLKGVKKYQRSIQGDGLDYIVKYFTEDRENSIFFDADAFENNGLGSPIWPAKLTEYLTGSEINPLMIDLKLLPSEFELTQNSSQAFRLVFQLEKGGRYTAFTIYARKDDQSVAPLVFGWGIVTSDDNLLILGKEIARDNENWSFTTLAFDNRWRSGLPPKSLVLRRAGLPIDDQIINDFSNDLSQLLIENEKASIWFCSSQMPSTPERS